MRTAPFPTVAEVILSRTATPTVAPTAAVPVPTARPPPRIYSSSSASAMTPMESPAVILAPAPTVVVTVASDTKIGIVPARELPSAAAAASPRMILLSFPVELMRTFPSSAVISAFPTVTAAVLCTTFTTMVAPAPTFVPPRLTAAAAVTSSLEVSVRMLTSLAAVIFTPSSTATFAAV